MEKKKMDETKKVKLIYSGELFIFSILFVVLGILFVTGVIPMTDRRKTVFTYLTLAGGVITLGDFIWALASKKRRAKTAIIDKILVLPSSLTFLSFDLYFLISGVYEDQVFSYLIGFGFIYLACVYLFESLYHYKFPIPGLLDDDEDKEKKNDAIDVEVTEEKDHKDE
ncbi:MAG: hypothetical protein LKF75_00485 [Bacilli bacterium]|jgi:hypothetical protein|nr:hypothetical protein [Bacilli bacterium]MCH4210290.1 hypothetical protein [Bacilli bacterium]MCH4228178.1 hypothetical protein [Bacilli bacterium]MCI2054630.1 hypothetical protein [Bacilli bacterium]